MVIGYFLFEGILYGFVPSLVNAYVNIVQGIFGVIIGILIVKVFEKYYRKSNPIGLLFYNVKKVQLYVKKLIVNDKKIPCFS